MFGNTNRDIQIADLRRITESLQKQIWELKSDQALLLRYMNLTRVTTPEAAEFVSTSDPRAVDAMSRLHAMYAAQQNMAPNPSFNSANQPPAGLQGALRGCF